MKKALLIACGILSVLCVPLAQADGTVSCTESCQYSNDNGCNYWTSCSWNGNCVTYTFCTGWNDNGCYQESSTTTCGY